MQINKEELLEALECCKDHECPGEECPYFRYEDCHRCLCEDAIYLINGGEL